MSPGEVVPFDQPFGRFETVFREAEGLDISDPNAMVVSSVGADGRPSSRLVLLKHFDQRGFVFYTNLESRKGREILANAQVCLNLFWHELKQQIVIEGVAEQVSDEEADAYFATRDRSSQLGAHASRQSRPMKNRAELVAEVARHQAQFFGKPVPRPSHWSGFRVVPTRFEFWEAGAFRLHKRTVFERCDDGWNRFMVFP